jgi:hypothetical protein
MMPNISAPSTKIWENVVKLEVVPNDIYPNFISHRMENSFLLVAWMQFHKENKELIWTLTKEERRLSFGALSEPWLQAVIQNGSSMTNKLSNSIFCIYKGNRSPHYVIEFGEFNVCSLDSWKYLCSFVLLRFVSLITAALISIFD